MQALCPTLMKTSRLDSSVAKDFQNVNEGSILMFVEFCSTCTLPNPKSLSAWSCKTTYTTMDKKKRKPPKYWPGLPTRGSQMFEPFVILFPCLVGISIAILLPLLAAFRGCRMEP